MKKILLVDDDAYLLTILSRQLGRHFSIESYTSPREALAALGNGQEYCVVVADMLMPEANGIEFLQQVRQAAPDVIRMILTGNADMDAAVRAVNQGHIFYFLTKPCSPDEMVRALQAGVRQYELVQAEKELLEQTLSGTINVLTGLLSMVVPSAFGKSLMLRESARQMALHLSFQNAWELEIAAMLSPLGLVTIPATLLKKARQQQPLSSDEQALLDKVPEVGRNLLAHIPRLENAATYVYYQNKNFDGTGFPVDRLAGNDIPLGGRVLRFLIDFVEQKQRGGTDLEIVERLSRRRGVYDPELLKAARQLFASAPRPNQSVAFAVQTVSLKELRVGDTLARNVETAEGTLIVSAPFVVTPTLKELLRNFAAVSGVREPLFVQKKLEDLPVPAGV